MRELSAALEFSFETNIERQLTRQLPQQLPQQLSHQFNTRSSSSRSFPEPTFAAMSSTPAATGAANAAGMPNASSPPAAGNPLDGISYQVTTGLLENGQVGSRIEWGCRGIDLIQRFLNHGTHENCVQWRRVLANRAVPEDVMLETLNDLGNERFLALYEAASE